MQMTTKVLQDICKQHNLYRTPHLNDKLYLNFQGFKQIENLEPYYGVKAVFLEGNALSSLDGLPQLEELKCLYVQQNRIKEIGDLSFLPVLSSLNISYNCVSSLAGLACGQLETLICTHNVLTDSASIAALVDCPSLQTVDLQNNKIEDPSIVEIFAKMPNLKCLYLKGNPAVSKIKQCRKQLIARIPTLTYFDDRPVFANEREIVEAWNEEGLEGERKAREAIILREKEQNQRNFDFMQAIRAEAFREKRERLGLPAGDTDPALDEFSDTEWEVPEDPPELVDARSKLDMHMKHISDQGSCGSELIPAYVTAGDGTATQEGSVSQGVAGLTNESLNPSLEAASKQLNNFAAAHSDMPPLEALPQQLCFSRDDLD